MPFIDLLDDNLRCPECPSRNFPREEKKKVVMGCGDCHAKILLVGEAPGKMENKIGKPFVGATGKELDGTFLPLAGLSRYGDVWITNTVCCHWADSSDAPPDWLVKSCSEYRLRKELERVNPEIVVLMGGISNGLLGLKVDTVHGTGRVAELLGWCGWTYSTYHPAIGMHKASAMQSLLDDFSRLRNFIQEPKEWTDEIPNPTYYRIRTVDEVDVIMGDEYDNPIAVDTESKKVWKGYKATIAYIPYCLQFCIHPHEAFLIMIEDKAAWMRFGRHINRFRRILMQNAPHDMGVLLESGISIDWAKVRDTMVMSYIDARAPKGLKPMSYQLLGTSADNFDDVVRPYGVHAAMEYIYNASFIDWPVPDKIPTGKTGSKMCPKCKGEGMVGEGRGKKRMFKECVECDCSGRVTTIKTSHKNGIGSKISMLLSDYLKNPHTTDPWKRWEGWKDDIEPLLQALGPLPLESIHLVPEDEIIGYACRDAVSTLRVGPIFLQRHTELRRRFSGENFQ